MKLRIRPSALFATSGPVRPGPAEIRQGIRPVIPAALALGHAALHDLYGQAGDFMSDDFGVVRTFLLAFTALFSIVNPIGTAFIFSQVTADRSHVERTQLARRIGLYSALVMLGALWGGTAVMDFFGVSIAALRIAGGLVVAAWAWELLSAPEERDLRKQRQAGQAVGVQDVAFFPLTLPMTTGPGTISVAIALGSNRPTGAASSIGFVTATSLAALGVAVLIWLAYRSSDSITAFLGETRVQIVTRLSAFLLLCVGVQIMLNGVLDALAAAGIGHGTGS
jgi:multiple antibiotic resistance protein